MKKTAKQRKWLRLEVWQWIWCGILELDIGGYFFHCFTVKCLWPCKWITVNLYILVCGPQRQSHFLSFSVCLCFCLASVSYQTRKKCQEVAESYDPDHYTTFCLKFLFRSYNILLTSELPASQINAYIYQQLQKKYFISFQVNILTFFHQHYWCNFGAA